MIERSTKTNAMTVNQMVEQLSTAYISLIKANVQFKNFPSVMLWGAPGVGKSQGVRQIASEIRQKTGKRVDITDVRLLLFNPVDLRGIPTANAEKTLAVWLRPKIFQMDASADVVNLLFLDEISAAPQSVQAAAYQITLDRTVGEHKLPENCIVMAAGNRVTDKSVAFNMPKALANRLCHIEIEGDVESWHRWAIGAGIHRFVLGFIDYNPDMLMNFDPQSNQLAFPTPRSWEMVSNILNFISEDVTAVMPLIVGCVGEQAAYELRAWNRVYSKIPTMEDIFEGKTKSMPVRPEGLYAVSSYIVNYASTHCSESEIRNALHYVASMPLEFKHRIYADLLQIKGIHKYLERNLDYSAWFERNGYDWERYGL